MFLIIKAITNVPDLVIDFVEVKLQSGKIVSLNWDRSSIDRCDEKFVGEYEDVCFDEESADGKLVNYMVCRSQRLVFIPKHTALPILRLKRCSLRIKEILFPLPAYCFQRKRGMQMDNPLVIVIKNGYGSRGL